MKILLIEDEKPAARRLQKLVQEAEPTAEIVAVIDSVEDSVKWLKTFPAVDLIFMDIQLADGLSFDIFTQVDVSIPVIFTTAYDQYTLKAFKVNSVDYLLKPIDEEELASALSKFKMLHGQQVPQSSAFFEKLLQNIQQPAYRERFLVKMGQQFTSVNVSDVAYCYAEDGLVFLMLNNGKRMNIDLKMEQLEQELDPYKFFRINRGMLISPNSISKIHSYFNSRLKLELNPEHREEVLVSRERVSNFKNWLDA